MNLMFKIDDFFGDMRDSEYNIFSLCREMLETPEVIKNFKTSSFSRFVKLLSPEKSILLTGEGSSRMEHTC